MESVALTDETTYLSYSENSNKIKRINIASKLYEFNQIDTVNNPLITGMSLFFLPKFSFNDERVLASY